METLEELRARHLREEAALLRAALEQSGWNLSRAAALLGVGLSSAQRALARHPELESIRERRGPGAGRPPARAQDGSARARAGGHRGRA